MPNIVIDFENNIPKYISIGNGIQCKMFIVKSYLSWREWYDSNYPSGKFNFIKAKAFAAV